MITAVVNKDLYRYEIQALIREFLRGKAVRVFVYEEIKKEDRETIPFLSVQYEPECLKIRLSTGREYVKTSSAGVCFDEKNEDLKKELKHLLYDVMCDFTGKELPWGELIGIRPTKLATRKLKEGCSDGEIKDFLKKTYRVSEGKADLSIEIARREETILGSLTPKKGYSLYIGVPFCPTTCLYCSFTSYPIDGFRSLVSDYLTALEKEMEAVSSLMREEGAVLDTVYVGGGTPTALTAEELDRLLTGLEKSFFDGQPVKALEFTVEAGRPDSLTREKVQVLKAHGVSRMSVNPQTMNDDTLKRIGRRHTVADVIEAYKMAREEGMDNINMDIILGLPGETDAEVRHTLEEIAKLSPDDLTVHSLAVKRGSRMAEWMERNRKAFPGTMITEDTIGIAEQGARSMGLEPYYLYRQKNMSGNFENVGYARRGRYGIYNILIIEEIQSILALGPGSVTKKVFTDEEGNTKILRCDDAKDIPTYIDHLDEMIDRKRRLFKAD